MPDFTSVMERVQADIQDTRTAFSVREDGRGIRSLVGPTAAYLDRLARAAELYADVLEGRRPSYLLREAMTTSDFPLIFGDILDRQIVAAYQQAPASWPRWARRRVARDFRTAKAYRFDAQNNRLNGPMGQRQEYKHAAWEEGNWEFGVAKYGLAASVAWEMLVNDDLDALQQIPTDLGAAARNTEEWEATEQLADANGPKATFFTAGNGNLITGNPALSIDGVRKGFDTFAKMKDPSGQPIIIQAVTLVVPPALEVTALNILNALQIELKEQGGTANQVLTVQNWMRNRLTLVVNYLLPYVSSTANGDTAWYLVAQPVGSRAAFVVSFLRGHEEPEVFIKEPNARRVGGAQVNPLDGDFESDAVDYKVRHVVGADPMDTKLAVASNGSGV